MVDMAKSIIWTEELLKQVLGETSELYIKELKEWVDFAIRSAIDIYYDNYEPKYYHRNYKLYSAYKIDVINGCINWNIEASNMDNAYRVKKKDYIYEIAFEGIDGYAYHGGATKGEPYPHPNEGIPYWRSGEHFSKWGERAARMEDSIESLIQKNLDEIDLEGIYVDIFLKVRKKYEKRSK